MSVIEIPNLRNSIAPVNAPPHMARIDSIRRPPREPAPPASLESAARPVMVKVSTVVVRSGMASLRTTAFRNPIATAVVITGVDSMEILDQACEAARTFRPMSEPELTALLSKTAKAAAHGEFEPFKTSSIFDGTAQNPAWLGDEPRRLQQLMP